MFDCEYFTHWAYWGIFPFYKVWVSNVGVANVKSGKCHLFSVSSVTQWLLIDGILYMVDLIEYSIVPLFLPFVMYELINGWFLISVWDFCIDYVWSVFLSALSFLCIPMWFGIQLRMKAPFSIATTPRCRGGHNSFPWIAPLHPWYLPYIAEC